MKKNVVASLLAVLMPLFATAGETSLLIDNASSLGINYDWGFDLRVRAVGSNNLPQPDHREEPRVKYLRIRSKLWGKIENEDVEVYLRLGNEPFYFHEPHSLKGMRRFPDVLYIDNIYITFKDLFNDFIDVKIGRQDIFDLGSDRIMLDGTSGDGSRSAYYNAIRTTLKFENHRTLDVLGIYNTNHDWMPSLGNDHPAPKPAKSYDFDMNGAVQDEWALALYWKDRSCETFPWDVYYFFKGEQRGRHSGYSLIKEGLNHFYTQTLGFRLQPKLTETIKSDFELALQWGDNNLFAGMAYGALHWQPWSTDACRFEPQVSMACLYYSGDGDGPRSKHSWHALFNRTTAIGDIPGGMFDKYEHTNLLYPHITFKFKPAEHMKFSTSCGPMYAPAAEECNGKTYGHYRGFFVNLYYEINIGGYTNTTWFQPFTISFLGEIMTKGGWFEDADEQGLGFYGQLDFTWSF